MFYLYFIACIRCEGFLLDKKIGVNQPKRIEKARILVANTPMDADKIKVGVGPNNRSLKKSIHSIWPQKGVCLAQEPDRVLFETCNMT